MDAAAVFNGQGNAGKGIISDFIPPPSIPLPPFVMRRNPKSEARNPKQIQNPNPRISKRQNDNGLDAPESRRLARRIVRLRATQGQLPLPNPAGLPGGWFLSGYLRTAASLLANPAGLPGGWFGFQLPRTAAGLPGGIRCAGAEPPGVAENRTIRRASRRDSVALGGVPGVAENRTIRRLAGGTRALARVPGVAGNRTIRRAGVESRESLAKQGHLLVPNHLHDTNSRKNNLGRLTLPRAEYTTFE